MAESTDLIVIEELNAVEVYTPEGIDKVLDTIKAKVLAHVPNIETASGRKDIASLAFKVSRSKTLLDDMGKGLVEDAKKTVKTIDGHRKKVRDTLDGLKEQVRQPLTEWEEAEDRKRVEAERKAQEAAQERVNSLAAVGVSLPFLQAKEMAEDAFNAMLKEATEAHEADVARKAEEKRIADEQAIADKKAREEAAAKLAAERAELDRQRAEDERKRKEEDARLRKEREAVEAQQKAERENIETERKAAEAQAKLEREKLESERRAIDEARREQERKIELERARKEAAEKAISDAKEKAEREAREKMESDAKAKVEAERQEALKPDKEKLQMWAASILNVNCHEPESEEAKAVLAEAKKRLIAVNRYVVKAAQEL